MSVKDKTAKMLYVDNETAKTLKSVAINYKVSESTIMRKALHNYFALYEEIIKGLENQENMFKG